MNVYTLAAVALAVFSVALDVLGAVNARRLARIEKRLNDTLDRIEAGLGFPLPAAAPAQQQQRRDTRSVSEQQQRRDTRSVSEQQQRRDTRSVSEQQQRRPAATIRTDPGEEARRRDNLAYLAALGDLDAIAAAAAEKQQRRDTRSVSEQEGSAADA